MSFTLHLYFKVPCHCQASFSVDALYRSICCIMWKWDVRIYVRTSSKSMWSIHTWCWNHLPHLWLLLHGGKHVLWVGKLRGSCWHDVERNFCSNITPDPFLLNSIKLSYLLYLFFCCFRQLTNLGDQWHFPCWEIHCF